MNTHRIYICIIFLVITQTILSIPSDDIHPRVLQAIYEQFRHRTEDIVPFIQACKDVLPPDQLTHIKKHGPTHTIVNRIINDKLIAPEHYEDLKGIVFRFNNPSYHHGLYQAISLPGMIDADTLKRILKECGLNAYEIAGVFHDGITDQLIDMIDTLYQHDTHNIIANKDMKRTSIQQLYETQQRYAPHQVPPKRSWLHRMHPTQMIISTSILTTTLLTGCYYLYTRYKQKKKTHPKKIKTPKV